MLTPRSIPGEFVSPRILRHAPSCYILVTQRSQNVTLELAKMRQFLQKLPLLVYLLSIGGRSLVENDDPSSFQGAPDLGYAPRFLSIFLALGFSRFEGESTPTPSG